MSLLAASNEAGNNCSPDSKKNSSLNYLDAEENQDQDQSDPIDTKKGLEFENGTMEIPVERNSLETGDGAKIFITDDVNVHGNHGNGIVIDANEETETEETDGARLSTFKASCLDSGSTGSLASSLRDNNTDNVSQDCPDDQDDERGGPKERKSSDITQYLENVEMENDAAESSLRKEMDLVKALDELSVTTASEDFKEAVTSNFRRQSILPVDPDEDFVSSFEWKMQKRHVFVLSESGKPIYSRYGNEENLVTLFGLLQALVSVVQDNDDTIRSINVGQTNIVFLVKSPLILVCVSRLHECVAQTQTQLMYFYNQIVSILTSKQLFSIFEKRRNYDLRRLLSGSERLLDNLGSLVENDPSFVLGAVKCLPLTSTVRETISQTIIQNLSKTKNVVFAILVANNQLVSLVRMKKCFMHPMDLHIILNLIDSSESFKTAESWTPLCLPRFDSSGFVHGHVSYLADDCQACLVLLTVDRDSFFALSEAKQKIVERLRRHNCLEAINASMSNNWPTMSYVNISEVRHFIYKSRSIAQFTSPALDIPYTGPAAVVPGQSMSSSMSSFSQHQQSQGQSHKVSPELQRLYASYFKMHSRLHSHSKPLKIIYWVDDTENWIGWTTTTFELYVAFEPLVKKSAAIGAVNKLLKWVKKEEDRIFIMNSPTF